MKYFTKTREITVRILTGIKFIDKKPFINPIHWYRHPRGGQILSPTDLADATVKLVSDAQASGFNVTIEDGPTDKFGMGETRSVITISNSFERMRAIMNNPIPEQLPEPVSKAFNHIIHPTQTHVNINFKDGPIQNLVLVGPKRKINIHAVGWPVLRDDDPGFSRLILVLENGGNYDIEFGDRHVTRGGIKPSFTKDGIDMLDIRSRGLGNVFVDVYMSNLS